MVVAVCARRHLISRRTRRSRPAVGRGNLSSIRARDERESLAIYPRATFFGAYIIYIFQASPERSDHLARSVGIRAAGKKNSTANLKPVSDNRLLLPSVCELLRT